MSESGPNWLVFVSHSSTDTWVAGQIAKGIEAAGASVFLDETDVAVSEDFEERILKALATATELLVLLTPWSLTRPYVWAEIGAAWGRRIPIVGVLHGLTPEDLQSDSNVPTLLKRRNLIQLNEIETYLKQLEERIRSAPEPAVGDQ